MKPTNIHVSSVSSDNRRYAAGWEDAKGLRHHVWVTDGKVGETIFRKPPVGPGTGYFKTRYLDGSKPKNAACIAEVMKAVVEGDMVAKLIEARDAKNAAADLAEKIAVGAAARKAAETFVQELKPPLATRVLATLSSLDDEQLVMLASKMIVAIREAKGHPA